jgi:hypothetical protein
MKKTVLIGFLALFQAGTACWGYAGPSVLHLDSTYDQELRYEAGADKTVTPSKVIRWIMGFNGQTITTPPSNVDFQPIVKVHDSNVKLIAAIAIKF